MKISHRPTIPLNSDLYEHDETWTNCHDCMYDHSEWFRSILICMFCTSLLFCIREMMNMYRGGNATISTHPHKHLCPSKRTVVRPVTENIMKTEHVEQTIPCNQLGSGDEIVAVDGLICTVKRWVMSFNLAANLINGRKQNPGPDHGRPHVYNGGSKLNVYSLSQYWPCVRPYQSIPLGRIGPAYMTVHDRMQKYFIRCRNQQSGRLIFFS